MNATLFMFVFCVHLLRAFTMFVCVWVGGGECVGWGVGGVRACLRVCACVSVRVYAYTLLFFVCFVLHFLKGTKLKKQRRPYR